MTNNEIMRASLLDILFDGRNKEYGAYAIRRGYNQRMAIALAMGISAVLFLCLFSMGHNSDNKTAAVEGDKGPLTISTITVAPDQPPIPKQKPQPSRPMQQAVKDIIPTIAPDNEVKHTEVPDNRDLADKVIGDKNMDGPPADGAVSTTSSPGTGTGSDNNQTVVNDPAPLPTYPPEFPGGMKALQEFLARNLVTPADLDIGDKKIVKARFIVDKDGSVSTVEIDVSGGTVFDREVIRVCKKMPKWKPAMQNGHPVVISYVLPVTFIGVEQ